MFKTFNKLQTKVREKVLKQEGQAIGRLKEEKVAIALQRLREKGEIRDYLWMGKLSYADLIEGVDFLFTYVDGRYRTCRFSITGRKWIVAHLRKHPEVPIFSVDLEERGQSIEQKILALKNNHSHG